MSSEDRPAGVVAYAALVRAWAPRLDLIAPGDLDRFEERHIGDCLRLAPLLEELPLGPCVDVGSGAGLPGIVLALAQRSRHWRLLEPRRSRAAFLEEAVRELDLDCEVLMVTAQAAAADPVLSGTHALATGRALAPPERALDLLEPLVAVGGVAAIFLGKRAVFPPRAEEWTPGIAIVPKG